MKVTKQKISVKTKLYYNQVPNQELVQLVNSHFQFQIGTLPEQPNLKIIKINYTDMPRETYTLKYNHEVYYIKKFYSLTFRQKLKYLSLEPRGLRSFLLSLRLTKASFNIPQNLFVLVYRKGFFNNESILVTKESQGVSLKNFIVSDLEINTKENAMLNFARTLSRFYRQGFIQTDTNLGNFFVEFSGSDYRLIFIDIDAIIYRPLFNTKGVLKSIARFFASLYSFLDKNNISNLVSFEKMIFLINIILLSYNSRLRIKALMFIEERIERNLNKWSNNNISMPIALTSYIVE